MLTASASHVSGVLSERANVSVRMSCTLVGDALRSSRWSLLRRALLCEIAVFVRTKMRGTRGSIGRHLLWHLHWHLLWLRLQLRRGGLLKIAGSPTPPPNHTMPIACPFCDLRFPNNQVLIEHLRFRHT
jgi:hypothetical protein